MAESSSSSSASGIGLAGLITAVFVCAKVFGFQPVASWSWWWVFCPLWIDALIGITIFVLISGVAIIAAVRR